MLILPATLTAREARVTQAMLSQALRQGAERSQEGAVGVDASALRHFDSAALAVLLECRRLAQGRGKSLVVRHPPTKLVDLARLYGVDELLALSVASAEERSGAPSAA